MQVERCFSLGPHSRLEDGMILFCYKGLKINHAYPVYLDMAPTHLQFYFHCVDPYIHMELFTLEYSDYLNPRGKLNRQINELANREKRNISLPDNTFENIFQIIEFPFFSFSHNAPSLSDSSVHSSSYPYINLKRILLDFLFEVKHGELFRLNPNFEKIQSICRENLMLEAISREKEYQYQIHLSHFQKEHSLINDEINLELLEEAKEMWIQLLINPEKGPFLSDSPWFEKNLEDKMQNSLTIYEELTGKGFWGTSDLTYQVSEWYLSRYNFSQVWSILIASHPKHKFYLVLPSLIGLCYLVLQFWPTFPGEVHPKFLALFLKYVWLGLGLIGACVISFVIMDLRESHLSKNSFPINKTQTVQFQPYNAIIYHSPQLIITIFLTWLAVNEVSIPNLGKLSNSFSIGVISLGLIGIYLFKEIHEVAPDLSTRAKLIRVVKTFIRSFGYALFVGIVVMNVVSDPWKKSSLQYLSEFNHFPAYICQMTRLTIPVLLTALFVSFLFKGKRFTSWYPIDYSS